VTLIEKRHLYDPELGSIQGLRQTNESQPMVVTFTTPKTIGEHWERWFTTTFKIPDGQKRQSGRIS